MVGWLVGCDKSGEWVGKVALSGKWWWIVKGEGNREWLAVKYGSRRE